MQDSYTSTYYCQLPIIGKGKHANREICYVGKGKWLLKTDKDNNPETFFMYCIIHRGILVSKNIQFVFKKVLESVSKCINAIKFNTNCKNIIQIFCKNKIKNHITLHIQVSCQKTTQLVNIWRWRWIYRAT